MTNREEIKSSIRRLLEDDHELADAYSELVGCSDCQLRDECKKKRTCFQTCYEFILEKLEADKC